MLFLKQPHCLLYFYTNIVLEKLYIFHKFGAYEQNRDMCKKDLTSNSDVLIGGLSRCGDPQWSLIQRGRSPQLSTVSFHPGSTLLREPSMQSVHHTFGSTRGTKRGWLETKGHSAQLSLSAPTPTNQNSVCFLHDRYSLIIWLNRSLILFSKHYTIYCDVIHTPMHLHITIPRSLVTSLLVRGKELSDNVQQTYKNNSHISYFIYTRPMLDTLLLWTHGSLLGLKYQYKPHV